MVQAHKSESGLGVDDTGLKNRPCLNSWDVMGGRAWASTPLDVVMENPIAVSNDKSILTGH